jgi:small subunit ribosomal protein S8
MSLNDPISNALSLMLNSERISRSQCTIKPISKTIKQILKIMQENMYIGEAKEVKDGKGNFMTINLLGKINRCGVIKPNYPVKKGGFERFEKRYLPAKDFGMLIVSTSKGIMTHEEAKKKGFGGKLLAYCY